MWTGSLAFGLMLSVVFFFAAPLYFMLGFTFVRWSTALALLLLLAVSQVLIVFLTDVLAAAGVQYPGQGILLWVFEVGVVVCLVNMLRGGVKGVFLSPHRMLSGMGALGMAAMYIQVRVLAPWFFSSTPTFKILFRLFAWPLFYEVVMASVRLCTRSSASAKVPHDRVFFSFTAATMAFSLVGRLMTTALDSLEATIGVSLALAAVELIMRASLPTRDAWYRAGWKRMTENCPGSCRGWCNEPLAAVKGGEHLQQTQELQSHFTFLTVDTIGEDIGVWLALAMGLTFRFPPSVGGPPLSTQEVLLRVTAQYFIELLADFGPVLCVLCIGWCCQARLPPWTGASCAGVDHSKATAPAAPDIGGTQDQPPHAEADQNPLAPAMMPTRSTSAGTSMASPTATSGGHAMAALKLPSQPSLTPAMPVLLDDAESPATAMVLQQAGKGGVVPPLPLRMPLPCRCFGRTLCWIPAGVCGCVLQAEEADVVAARAAMESTLAKDLSAIARDPVWQPVSSAQVLAQSLAEGGTEVFGVAVGGESGQQPTRLGRLVLHTLVSAEMVAVRLDRAWTSRFKWFEVVLVSSSIAMATLVLRLMAGPRTRCLMLDDAGERYFDACPLIPEVSEST